jgi:chemotaxis protein CheC
VTFLDNYENLNEIQLSVLSEIGNIGGGNAATALSTILSDRVAMSVPDLKIIDVSTIAGILGGPENEVVGILLNMTEAVEGMLLFVLDKEFICMLISVLMDEKISSFEEISEMGFSALKEIGNILAGSYVSAISMLTGLDIKISTPHIAVDMVGAILSYPAAQFGTMGDRLLLIEEDFFANEDTIKSHLLIMPEMKSLETILKTLGVT